MSHFKKAYFSLFLLCFIISKISAYRILVISPFNSKSHNNMLESVAKALARSGHQVDVISHFELKNHPKNYTTIINLDGTMRKLMNSWSMDFVEFFRNSDFVSLIARDFGNNYCELMSLEKMQKLIKSPPKDPPYDLVITEALGANCFFGFGHILKVPVVVVSALIQLFGLDDIIANPISSAFAVNINTEKIPISTFWDRVKNTFLAYYSNYKFFKYTEKMQTESMRKYLSPDIPNIREIEKNVALLLINTYQSMFGIKPNTPSFVQIAGIQIEQSDAEMTPELKIWMNESVNGVVFFSLGSMVIIEDFPKEVLLSFYASFAKLAPIRVLMKIVNKERLPPGLPNNVMIMPWISQIPVLRHNNTRLFLTHGGLNSLQEALYFGVPMIGFPLFADQMLNIKLLAAKDVVFEMNYKNITEKTLDAALNIVLSKPKYREAAMRESRLFKDRPLNATETAVFWVEYIIRNGANSLRSPAMDLDWWKIELLDVHGFFVLCIFIICYVLFSILRIITSTIFNLLNSSFRGRKKMD